MPTSHHSHSGQFCKHAKGTLEAVIEAAIRQGFTTYGLSEHMPRSRAQDLYPEEDALTPADLLATFSEYIATASKLKAYYAERISLLVGLETEHICDGTFADLDAVLAEQADSIDYLVGSVHHVREVPIDFDRATFDKAVQAYSNSESLVNHTGTAPLERLFCDYFDSQFALLERFQPEVIGHLDLCRLYHPDERLDSHPEVWRRVERNILKGIEYGALFEVNSAAVRKGWLTPYPGPEVLRLILQHNGRLTLSDDSHGPHAVGLNYAASFSYLRREGVTELWYLQAPDHQETLKDGSARRRAIARKVEGNWWEHAFWRGKVASITDESE